MAIAKQVAAYLQQMEADFKVVVHPHSSSSMDTAERAHVPGDALAKGIVLKEDDGYLLVVLPSDYHVELENLGKKLQQKVKMVDESELDKLFPDCELGAVPPLGTAYGIKTIWDPETSLGRLDEIFFEAGDHQHLIQVSGEQFHELMATAERGGFSHHI